MTGQSRLPIQNSHASQHNLTWSKSERVIARKAFDAALKRELTR